MQFHTFGDKSSPAMVLIHGMMTPWQVWTDMIEAFRNRYYVIVPELDAHTENEVSSFESVEDEAVMIAEYLLDNDLAEIDTICGMSMGGAIAYTVWEYGTIGIKNLVLDGAPLRPMPAIAEKLMTMSYNSILKKTAKRDEKTLERCKREFLPERYIDDFLKLADNMEKESVKNIMHSVCNMRILGGLDNESRILFIHGTKGNETVSKKAAEEMKKLYPETQILCYEGDPHVYKAIRQTDIWIRDVDTFINDSKTSI